MTITCPNCGDDIEFFNQGHEYEALCDCGFQASITVASVQEPERWEDQHDQTH